MKKGFTLVEIMAVILILGVILVIAIPTFNKVVEESKNKLYKNLNDTVVKTTKTYATENAFLMPTEEGESIEVTVNELISAGYLKELKNPGDKEDTCNGYVIITRLADEQYAYNPHINCSTDIASSTEDGLVLHYTFDDFQEPTTNIVPNTDYSNRTYFLEYTTSSWGGDYAKITHYPNGGYNDMPYKKMVKTLGGTGGSYHDNHHYFVIENNKTYAISAWMKANQNATVSSYSLDLNRAADNAYRVGSDINLSTTWKKVSWIYNSGSSGAGNYLARNIVYNDTNLPLEVYWCCFQVESKEYSTPYVNGSRTGTVKDYSGNNNVSNLSLDTTPRWMSNTDGISGYYDLISGKWMTVGHSQSLNLNSFTINVWVKYRDYTYPKTFGAIKKSSPDCYLSTGKGFDFGHGYKSLGLDVCLGDGVHVVRNTLQFNLGNRPPDLLNKWTHLSLVVDRSSGYIYSYINGELQSHKVNISTVTGDINTTASLTIGTLYGWTTDASLDDFRIYNRVLNAEEIKFIYEMTK